MDKQHRRDLIRQYKEDKRPMGVFFFRCKTTDKLYLGCGSEVQGHINRELFQLKYNNCRYKSLQRDWNEFGEQDFEYGIFRELEYNEDESKTDYREELAMLLQICLEENKNSERLVL